MALHFLLKSRIREAVVDRVPGHFLLYPGVLLCHPGDLLDIEGYGRYRVLSITWGGEDGDEADVAVEPAA